MPFTFGVIFRSEIQTGVGNDKIATSVITFWLDREAELT